MRLEQAADYLGAHEAFILTSHDGPDADGLGAAYALALALRSLGKKAEVFFSGPVPAKFAFIDRRGLFKELSQSLPDLEAEKTCVVVLDTHDPGYLGSRLEDLIERAAGLVFIDHHEPRGKMGASHCVDASASSTCELVFRLVKLLGAELSEDAAEAIFSGIVYDTGSFAYPKTGASTFQTALELVQLGVQPYTIHNRMYESSSIGVLILQKIVYSTLELRLDNRVAIQVLGKGDLALSGASYEDAEDLVNLPLRGRSVEVSLLFKENLDGRLRCSLRSKGGVNVAHLAQNFGGGGHKTAAGFSCSLPLEAMKAAVLESIERLLSA